MDKIDELLLLMDLEKSLKPKRYDALNLMNIDLLRIEVERRINKIKDHGKSKTIMPKL